MPIGIGTAILGSAGLNLLGGYLGSKSASDANQSNAELQREFAQHGIRWKVADAKAAGIHPLAALGATTQGPAIAMQDEGASMGQALNLTAQQLTNMAMQNQAMEADAEVKRTQALLNLAKVDDIAKIPSLFINAKDPISGQTIRVLNPEFGQLEGTTAWMGGLNYANPETDLTEMFAKRYRSKSKPRYINPRTNTPGYSGSGRGIPQF